MKLITNILTLMLIPFCTVVSQQRVLTLFGESEVTEPANRAEFSFIVDRDGKDLQSAFVEAQNYLNSIFHDLRDIGLDSTSLQQSRVRIDEKSLTWFTSQKYKAVLRTKIVLSNLSILESVLDVLNRYEIENLSDVQFGVENEQSLRQKAYIEALQSAKRDAESLSKAEGFLLGEVTSIIEETEQPRDYNEYFFGAKLRGGTSISQASFFPDQIKMYKKLKVTFAIN